MKRLVIVIALALVFLCLIKGAPQGETNEENLLVSELYRTVDDRLAQRMPSLQLGAELSAALTDPS